MQETLRTNLVRPRAAPRPERGVFFQLGLDALLGAGFNRCCRRNVSNMARQVVDFQGSVFGCVFRPRFWGRPYWRVQ